jgi:L-iditol 2-dehydrogenase
LLELILASLLLSLTHLSVYTAKMSTDIISNAAIYNPRKVLDHPEFRVLKQGEKLSPEANIAAFYNPAHEIHLVEKPRPKPGPGQVLLHVRATGICG